MTEPSQTTRKLKPIILSGLIILGLGITGAIWVNESKTEEQLRAVTAAGQISLFLEMAMPAVQQNFEALASRSPDKPQLLDTASLGQLIQAAVPNADLSRFLGKNPFGQDLCVVFGPVGKEIILAALTTGGEKASDRDMETVAAAFANVRPEASLGVVRAADPSTMVSVKGTWSLKADAVAHVCTLEPGHFGAMATLSRVPPGKGA